MPCSDTLGSLVTSDRTARLSSGIAAPLWLALSSLVLFLFALLLLAITGCGERGPSALFGTKPTPPVRLVDLQPVVHGTPTETSQPNPRLLRWLGGETEAWKQDSLPAAVRFTSPQLDQRGLDDAGVLHVRLRPGGATRISIVPYAHGMQLDREHQVLRRIEIPLERDAAAREAVDLEVDLYEALHGNLGDAGRAGRLAKLEITLPGASEEAAELLGVTIRGRQQQPPDAPAGTIIADHQGVLRPAWFVRGGVAVNFELTLPEGAVELRWHDGAHPGTGARSISVRADDEAAELWRAPAADPTLGVPWQARALSLEQFAGSTISLSLRTDGAGTGLFGEPRILAPEPVTVPADVAGAASPPDVLVYLMDTLRADRLGAAGNKAPGVSPTLDRLARSGAWFELALSSSPWTKPAIATLMSGILPTTHGVGASTYTDRMPASVPLVQERFRAAGWRTGSFAASPLGSTLSALERGFSVAYPPRFWGANAELAMNPSAAQLSDALLSFVDERPDEPFFAYVHTLEVHEWKLARYQSQLPAGFTNYDAAILDADRQLGLLLTGLDERKRGRDLLVVVVSDHGESFGDHGMPSHGFGLFQSQIHIPLIFWSSAGALEPRRIAAPVSLADLAPTLLDGFALEPLDDAWGRSLTGYLEGDSPEGRPILSSLLRFVWAPNAPRQFAITTPERVKVIRREQPGRSRAERSHAESGDIENAYAESAYDLMLDPNESHALADALAEARPALERELRAEQARAEAFRGLHGRLTPGAVTSDDAERLRALGYLEGDPGSSEAVPENRAPNHTESKRVN